MRARILAVVVAVAACGGSTEHRPADGGLDAPATPDAPLDVDTDGPRVWCDDSTFDGGGMFCPPGMICGNSGGVQGNFCCYQQDGAPDYYCP